MRLEAKKRAAYEFLTVFVLAVSSFLIASAFYEMSSFSFRIKKQINPFYSWFLGTYLFTVFVRIFAWAINVSKAKCEEELTVRPLTKTGFNISLAFLFVSFVFVVGKILDECLF